MKITSYILLFCLCLSDRSNAQNNTSPYSILGIGDIETAYYGRWSGMGHAGSAISSNRYLNHANAASLAKLDDQFFVLELSGRYKYIRYSGESLAGTNTSSDDLSIKKAAVAVKLTKKWGSSIGLNPFSSSNYSFYSKKTLQGTNYQTDFYNEGTGGINQFYWANGYKVNKNLSLGVQAGYLFGSLNQTEVLTSALSSTIINTERNIFLRNPYIVYAIQYTGAINKNWQVAIGGTYASRTKLNASYSLIVTDDNTSVIEDQAIQSEDYFVPETYMAGIALTYHNNLTIAGDYRRQNWGVLNYKGLNYELVNSHKYVVGFEYAKKYNVAGRSFERSFYQAGVFYNNAYVKLKKQQLRDYGITLGIGANAKRSALGYQVTLELGTRGTINKGLIKENYGQLTFTLLYRDLWFTKGKKYD